jgi:signal transduction histidine kinase
MMLLSGVLLLGAAFALGVATFTGRRRSAPGKTPFLLLMAAVAVWCATSGFHALAESLEAKLWWARVQYLGIASVPPLWLLFAGEYADAGWTFDRRVRIAVWVVPILTVLAVATNDWHHAIWPSMRIDSSGLTVYGHGWAFWVAAAYNYLLVLEGTTQLVLALLYTPPPFRGQWLALIVAAVTPLVGNVLYISRITPPGLDLTPVAFAASGILFVSALYRDHLFDLVPVARDAVVESLSDAVIVLDESRRTLDMNAAARRLAGDPETWVGQPVDALVPLVSGLGNDAVRDSSVTLVRDVEGGQKEYFDARILRVRRPNWRSAAWVALVRDVSERTRAEAARTALEARVREQQKRESLSILAGGVARDFNELLAGIVVNADRLTLKVAPSSEMGESLGAILLAAQRAADLVDTLLAYAGERQGSPAPVDLDELVREMVGLLRGSAARHCALRYAGRPAPIDADPTQIRQVAMNLILNAIDAVDAQSGEIVVATGVDDLSGPQLAAVDCADDAVPGLYAYLDVADNGRGMDEATVGRIFQPFFTSRPSRRGLGLAAVQGIVHAHRGALRVESAPGQGTRFRVWFPLAAGRRVEAGTRIGVSLETGVRSRR